MKHLLLTTIAAVVLVGCGESQQSPPTPEAKPIEPVAEASTSEPPTAKAPDISIHQAAEDGNIEAVKQHLAAGTEVTARDKYGRTPLHGVTTKEITELLIAKGAEVNAEDEDGWTPLHFAAARGHKETAELLIAKGADVNAKDDEERTPLHYAAYKGHKEMVELLIAEGADVNAKDDEERTPLHYAAYKGHKEMVELLIAKGADVNAAKDGSGDTPLDWAIEKKPRRNRRPPPQTRRQDG